MVWLALLATAAAATHTVDPAGGADFTTIQAAIAAAADGDTIEVGVGTYTECLDLGGKDLSLTGTGGAAATTVDCGGAAGSAILALAGEVATVQGFTVKNGSNRALRATGATLTLDDLVVSGTGNSGMDGGVMSISGGAVMLSNSTFSAATAWKGGAIYATGGALVMVSLVQVDASMADNGGFAYLDNDGGPATLELDTVAVDGVSAIYDGGGIYGELGSSVSSVGSTFSGITGRSGTDGGAIYLEGSSALVSEGDTFEANGAGTASTAAGGALYVAGGGTLSLSHGTFSDNAAYRGGAIFLGSGVVATVDSSTFSANHTKSWGGAIQCADAVELEVNNSDFADNQSDLSKGGDLYQTTGGTLLLYAVRSSGAKAAESGGAVYVNGLDGPLGVVDSSFTGAQSGGNGGAIAVEGEMGLDLDGVTVSGSTATGSGGAVYFYPTSPLPDLHVTDATFDENTAGGDGGAVYAFQGGAVRVKGSSFASNVAGPTQAGGGLYVGYPTTLSVSRSAFCTNAAYLGGAIYTNVATGLSEWTNSAFVENEAWHLGGALYLSNVAGAVFDNNVVLGNLAAKYGGGLYLFGSSGTFRNTVYADNSGGAAVYAEDSASAGSRFTYGAWSGNVAANAGGTLAVTMGSDGNIAAAPDFLAWSADGDCTNDDLRPATGSALVDAGDPGLFDPDGSRSDIGLYGGPGALSADGDGDGFLAPADCNDLDPAIHPGADERCDFVDNDCDGSVDEEAVDALTLCADGDDDGYGAEGEGIVACESPPGFVADCSDCDDADPARNPGAEEVVGDDIDQDCDGSDAVEGGDDTAAGGDGGLDGAGDDGPTGLGDDVDAKNTGCAVVSGGGAWGLLGALALLLRRRAQGRAAMT